MERGAHVTADARTQKLNMLNTKVFALTSSGEWKKGNICFISAPGRQPQNYNQAHVDTEFTVEFDDKRTRTRRLLKAQIFPLEYLNRTPSPVVDLTEECHHFSSTREEEAFRATTPSKPDYSSKLKALKTQMAKKERRFEDELKIIKQQLNGPIQNQLDDLSSTFNWQLYDSFRMDKQVDMYSPQMQAQEGDCANSVELGPVKDIEKQTTEDAGKERKCNIKTFKKLNYEVAKNYDIPEKGERTNRRMSKRQRTEVQI